MEENRLRRQLTEKPTIQYSVGRDFLIEAWEKLVKKGIFVNTIISLDGRLYTLTLSSERDNKYIHNQLEILNKTFENASQTRTYK